LAAGRAAWRSEAHQVWAVAWPLILTNMLHVAVGIVDLKMVGMLGVGPIAAVGMSRQVAMLLLILTVAVSGGTSVLVARAHGAGDKDQVRKTAARSMAFLAVGSVLIVVPLGLLTSRPLLVGLGADAEVLRLGTPYLHILFAGSVFGTLNFGVTAVLLGVGRTKVSLVLLAGVNGLNVLFNYLLIFGVGPFPRLGVSGAALGTVVAHACGLAFGIWTLRAPSYAVEARLRDAAAIDFGLLRKMLYLGGPRSLQGIVRNLAGLVTIRIITLLPDATRAVSAYSVCMQVTMVSSFVGLAFMSAALSRVGQNLGRGEPEVAARSGWIAAVMASAQMSVFAILFVLLPHAIVGFFTADRSVIDMGRVLFLTVALAQPIMGFAFALSGALRGGGDPVAPFLFAATADLLVVNLVGYLLAIHLGIGFQGIALAITLGSLARAIPMVLRFRAGRWKTRTV